MSYVIIDLEFNGRKHYEIYPMEIIEIGALCVDSSLQVINTFQSYVKPHYPINRFALEYCKIDGSTLQRSPSFPEVIGAFIDFCGQYDKIIAWGSMDFHNLYIDSKVNQVPVHWLHNMLDMSKHFTGGLQEALVTHEIKPIGQQHSALDDAWNAYQLLCRNPKIVLIETYYQFDPFKTATGGIKKKIAMSLQQAAEANQYLSWEQFMEEEQARDYIRIMNLDAREIEMVHKLFDKYYKQTYSRKVRERIRKLNS
ncbi:3'-5' exonuclease [Paenibacillus sp. YYML68]|uniref:3'-5' exonuclease n=1 Tax=Paenibacillus sp. YYML68 TaxID=2909250 RepID=UPI002492543D|nr:3'-5' exonuclease [Paenibacillus sp. YYML68]